MLSFDGEIFSWDGDQVAFVSAPGLVCTSLTEEDMINGEIPKVKRKIIRANKKAIIDEIKKLGFEIEK